MKAPEMKRLKLIRDDPLSNFAFKFNLRRYNWGDNPVSTLCNYQTYVLFTIPGLAAGAYTCPLFQLNVNTFCGIRYVSSVCQ